MFAYRKERIDNAAHYFAKEHYKKTHQNLSQTALYKYLAFFEFRLLKKYGEMPLGLHYSAMDHGPVPDEIYKHRKPDDFSKIEFVPFERGFLVKPTGNFEEDYFSENELEEMQNLIEIFAQRWVNSTILSDSSHSDIKSWKKAYRRSKNSPIDPAEEFERNIDRVPESELTPIEEKFLFFRNTLRLAGG